MCIKNIIRKIIYKERSSSQAYISYMRSRGAKIGDTVLLKNKKFYDVVNKKLTSS